MIDQLTHTMYARTFLHDPYDTSKLLFLPPVSEVIGAKYRARYGAMWQIIFSLGYAILPFYAYFVRDESKLQSVLTWPICIFFIIVLWVKYIDNINLQYILKQL